MSDHITNSDTEVDGTVIEGGIIIPEFRAGAMENPGPITTMFAGSTASAAPTGLSMPFAGVLTMFAGRLPEPRQPKVFPPQQNLVDPDADRRMQQARLQHDQ